MELQARHGISWNSCTTLPIQTLKESARRGSTMMRHAVNISCTCFQLRFGQMAVPLV